MAKRPQRKAPKKESRIAIDEATAEKLKMLEVAYQQLGDIFTMVTGSLWTMMATNTDMDYVEGQTAGGRKVGVVITIGDERTEALEALAKLLKGQAAQAKEPE